jgi:hypothetical protein
MVNKDEELGAADLIPSCAPDAVPWVSVAQVREVDRAAIAISKRRSRWSASYTSRTSRSQPSSTKGLELVIGRCFRANRS